MHNMVEQFAILFAGRPDAYGGDEGRAIYQPVTIETYENHLTGIEPIGIYPIQHSADGLLRVQWGCCDIDTGDWSEAYMLATALQGMGLVPHVERSRSKGWHIWVFANYPAEAWQMRRALKVAYAAIDLPAKEANPKQEQLRRNQLGNYVRLPYKSGLLLTPERQVMMVGWNRHNDGYPLPLKDWLDGPIYSEHTKIVHWASKWYERPRKHVQFDVSDSDIARLAGLLPAEWRQVWQSGEVRDRSATFVAMAYSLAKLGWQPQDVYMILWGCPWNKYRERADGEHYVKDIIDRVYS